MSVQLAPSPVFRAVANDGTALSGGKLFTYIAGTTTPQATYVDSTQTTPNTNPIILNSRGEANVWLVQGLTYKLLLQDALGNLIWSVDQIAGNNLPFGITVSAAGNVTIGPPTSGLALTVNAASGQQGILINADTTSGTSALQSHVVANAVAGGLVLQNQSLGPAAGIVIDIQNATATFIVGMSGSGFTGAFVPGGPIGTSAGVLTNGPIPLVLGTSFTAVQVISAAGNVTINAPTGGVSLIVNSITPAGVNDRSMTIVGSGAGDSRLGINTTTAGNAQINFDTFGVQNWVLGNSRADGALHFASSQTLGISDRLSLGAGGVIAFNGAAGAAPLNGWGTPTGNAVIANYPGATATLVQTSNVVAQIVATLKALGFYGA
jgi:hypothetical protein